MFYYVLTQYGRPLKVTKSPTVKEGKVAGPFKSDDDEEDNMNASLVPDDTESPEITILSESESCEMSTPASTTRTRSKVSTDKREDMIDKVRKWK